MKQREDDEALVEIAKQAILKETDGTPLSLLGCLPAAIAAIRPHIEAEERERCAKIATGQYWSSALGSDGTAKAIAAAIRRKD